MGMNPAVSGPNSRMERQSLANLDWLVVMDLFETETASFWRAPGTDPKNIQTEVFLLPALDAMEKIGSIVTSGRRIQWRPRVALGPGQAQSDVWILDRLAQAIKKIYQSSPETRDLPIRDLTWFYGEGSDPDPEIVAREISGYAFDDVKDASGAVILAKGALLPAFATIASAVNYDAIACGNWLYAGYFAPAGEMGGGKMTITATSAESGDNLGEIDATVDGEPVEIAFNARYLSDVLNVLHTPQVALETSGSSAPGVVKAVGRDDFTHVIMPMHIK